MATMLPLFVPAQVGKSSCLVRRVSTYVIGLRRDVDFEEVERNLYMRCMSRRRGASRDKGPLFTWSLLRSVTCRQRHCDVSSRRYFVVTAMRKQRKTPAIVMILNGVVDQNAVTCRGRL